MCTYFYMQIAFTHIHQSPQRKGPHLPKYASPGSMSPWRFLRALGATPRLLRHATFLEKRCVTTQKTSV